METTYYIRQHKGCSSLDEAVSLVIDRLTPDKDIHRQLHQLGPYQGYPVHKHSAANEWTIIYDAVFTLVRFNGSVPEIRIVQSSHKATVVYIPVGVWHTVRSRASGMRYAVLKDGPDDFIICRQIMRGAPKSDLGHRSPSDSI